jgi:ABC-type transport system involved in multi-copper enzyme maturation permease subunit
MSGNEVFELVSERGWMRGLGNLVRGGLERWFKTRMWWIQCLIWGGLAGLMMSMMLFAAQPDIDTARIMFSVFIGLMPGVGVVIIMQDALVGEKLEGTAAWVLSKPVAREAFYLSKMVTNGAGILFNLIVAPTVVGFVLFSISLKEMQNPLAFLGVMGVIFISHMFFLSFTLMLGALVNNRGAVIGIGLSLLFFQQNLTGLLPVLRYVLPWSLVAPLSDPPDSLVFRLLLGKAVGTDYWITLGVVLVEITIFTLIGLWKFKKQEL